MILVNIPPSTNAADFLAIAEALAVEVAAIKSSVKDPAIFIAGDLNKRDLCPSLAVVDDFKALDSPPTRGNVALDRLISNAGGSTKVAAVLPPLETPGGLRSDHGIVYDEAEFPAAKKYIWIARWRRTRNKEREDAFAGDHEHFLFLPGPRTPQ